MRTLTYLEVTRDSEGRRASLLQEASNSSKCISCVKKSVFNKISLFLANSTLTNSYLCTANQLE